MVKEEIKKEVIISSRGRQLQRSKRLRELAN